MNKKVLIFVLAASMLLAGCGSKTVTETEEQLTPVEVVGVTRGTIKNDYVFSGQISASNEVNIIPKIAGKVLSVNYDVGDEVGAGSVLFTIDGSDIQNNINVLRSQLAAADTAINSAQIGVDLANGSAMQSQIAAAKAGVDQLKIALDNAQKRYSESKTLYDSGYISKVEFEQYESGYNQALISYNQAKESYDILVNKTSSENNVRAQSALEQARAAKASVAAQIASLQDTLRDTVVTSPISGVVSARSINAGTLVSGAQVPFAVSNIDIVTMDVDVSEQNINMLTVGQVVDVEIASFSDQTMTGEILTINPVANQMTGTYAVRISIKNPEKTLKPGMFGQVHFTKEKSDNALTVERNAVLGTDTAERYVFVEENGTVKKVAVTTGIDNGMYIEITGGLSENQRVVVKGQEFLNDGDAVEAVVSSEKGE